MDEIQGNNIARNFSSEYFNYTINFIISKEFPALTDFPRKCQVFLQHFFEKN